MDTNHEMVQHVAPHYEERVVKNNDWSSSDTAREAIYLTLHVIDWGQTRNITHRYQRGEDYNETNRVLGKHPSIKRIDSYMAFTALAHIGVAYTLPRKWREAFQYTTIGFNLGVVYKNNGIGLKVDF